MNMYPINQEKYDKNMELLTTSNNDVRFIQTENGAITHISVNNVTFCADGSRLMFYCSKIPPLYAIHNYICYVCLHWSSRICGDNIFPHDTYRVSLRCNAMVKAKGKGKGKKIKRCLNNIKGHDESFCNQHNKCFLAYINKYISVSNDVAKIIHKLL